MASRVTTRFIFRLPQTKDPNFLHSNHRTIFTTIPNSTSQSSISSLFESKVPPFNHHSTASRFFSTAQRHPNRPPKLHISGFIIIVLNQFEDQLVFYVTPTDALVKYYEIPSKNKFLLSGLVIEGSVAHLASSHEIEFVITDLITDMLVRYE
ncbi:putative ccmE/CycJ protein [Helianthus anomalus]